MWVGSTFLTFPQNPQQLLSDGREFTSVFPLVCVEAFESAEEIHTAARRHAVRGIWRSFFFFYPRKVQTLGLSVTSSQTCWVSSYSSVLLKQGTNAKL